MVRLFHNNGMNEKEKTLTAENLLGTRIERMFSSIAPWYDFLNRGLSLRQDVYWRRALVKGLQLPSEPFILDLAAGTLDVSLETVRQHPQALVAAVDFSLPMLHRGREKLAAQGQPRILPIAADAMALPFANDQFDGLTIAFGIRNLPDRGAALQEILRVLRPGGVAAILEFIPPEVGWRLQLYRLYLNHLLPLIGRVFSRHAFAYRYLAESIVHFPPATAFCQELQEVGFHQVRYRRLTFGVVCLFYGKKA